MTESKITEKQAGKYRRPQPVVVQECAETALRFPVPDQVLMIQYYSGGQQQKEVINPPQAELQAQDHQRDEQHGLHDADADRHRRTGWPWT